MSRSPNLLHSDAIVLRSMDYGETSRIVTLFTRERGKMAVIAKGARAGRARFGSTLDPLAYVHVVVHVKEGRDLQILSETSHIRTFEGIRSSLERIEPGLRMVELTTSLLQDDQEQLPVFALLTSALTALEESPGRTGNVWPYFQLRLASILGFEPSFDNDFVKGMTSEEGVLDLETGNILGDGRGMRASRQALRAFSVLARAQLQDVMRMNMDVSLLHDVSALVSAYLRYHLDDAYPRRSDRVFAQLDVGKR